MVFLCLNAFVGCFGSKGDTPEPNELIDILKTELKQVTEEENDVLEEYLQEKIAELEAHLPLMEQGYGQEEMIIGIILR